MKLDQEEKRTDPDNVGEVAASRSKSRRDFLHKSSATVLITSLAAQPVWGRCTVSGAMSGGSATQGEEDPCVVPEVWGQPSDSWAADVIQGSGDVTEAFVMVEDKEALRCFIAQVRAENFFTVPATPTNPAETVGVNEALAAPGGIHFYLAGIWLNAYFGFFDGGMLPGRDASSPQEWVEHFFSLSLASEQGEWTDEFLFQNVFRADATTQWSGLPEGYTCG